MASCNFAERQFATVNSKPAAFEVNFFCVAKRLKVRRRFRRKKALKKTQSAFARVAHLRLGSLAHRLFCMPPSAPLFIRCPLSLAVLVAADLCHQFQPFPRVTLM